MSSDVASDRSQPAAAPAPRSVVYVGDDQALIVAALAPLGQCITLKPEPTVTGAMLAVAQHRADVVVVDLNAPDDARMLLVAALANARHRPRIVLLGRRDRVGELLKLPGVYCVITYPLLPSQIRAAIADRRSKRRNNEAPKEPPADLMATPDSNQQVGAGVPEPAHEMADFKAPEVAARQRAWPGWRLYMLGANRFMAVVSTLYKNMAFVLLASLFSAFCFYGFLIGYFLLASGWGSPVTLSPGHQLVETAATELSNIKVALALNTQRYSAAELDARKAQGEYADAKVLAAFLNSSIDSEIATRTRQAALAKVSAERAQKVLKSFSDEAAQPQQASPRELFNKRLITRKTYEAQVLGSAEMGQRIVALQTQADTTSSEAVRLQESLKMLKSLKSQLEGAKIEPVNDGSADLIPLAKDAIQARTTLDTTQSALSSANERMQVLDANGKLLHQRIADLEQSAVGRAIESRIDVIFVPYGNERGFIPGAALYTCRLTVLFCHRAGTVGNALPGESTSVHPFFGKSIRGFYVEAKLDDPSAASQEIIHAGRPPFFF